MKASPSKDDRECLSGEQGDLSIFSDQCFFFMNELLNSLSIY